jgi:hypothetical protein
MKYHQRNKTILSLRGKKSYGLIAKELGITVGTVAGVCFRSDWPAASRSGDKRNKAGIGHHGGGRRADETLWSVGERA